MRNITMFIDFEHFFLYFTIIIFSIFVKSGLFLLVFINRKILNIYFYILLSDTSL